ncbi:MAG TPA: LemA family protein [Alphaproteobacteria bacterium]|nr:LemA family protein [Alphaproteobacteria bacterium]USO05147.1 MAG: LemA family protein [Rhodospirillales bacterium]HOO82394.1 LemA family protein [Alphaproteobacteria bacterium]
MEALWIILGLVVLTGLVVITIYNRLVALRQNREQSFADIDVQLKQRFDLIPNLVKTVKGYAAHEKEVLENVTNARAGVASAGNMSQRVSAENALSRAMISLFAVAENYPDLKADGTFNKLMDELSDIENKLAAARRFFNNATAELNTAVEQFPAVLFAGMFGFSKEEFFEVPEDARETLEKAPDVSFE